MPDVVVLYGVDCRCVEAGYGRGVVAVKDDADAAAIAKQLAKANTAALSDAGDLAAELSEANPGVPTAITTAAGDVVDVYQDGKALGVKAYPPGWDGGPDVVESAADDRRPAPPAPTPIP